MKMTKTKTLREKEMKIMLRTIKEQQKEIIDLKKHITKRNVIIIELKAKIKTMKND